LLAAALGAVPLLAQEKKDMPMKGEGMEEGGIMMGKGSKDFDCNCTVGGASA
jgi:hypothetical protein